MAAIASRTKPKTPPTSHDNTVNMGAPKNTINAMPSHTRHSEVNVDTKPKLPKPKQ
jgi:hypothetical protein